jgi:hypothetical protein
VLWGSEGPVETLLIYMNQSFGLVDYYPVYILKASLILILVAVLRRSLSKPLLQIFLIYMVALSLFYVLTILHIPFGRPRYSLYLLPVPFLVTLVSILSFKPPRLLNHFLAALVVVAAGLNLKHSYYGMSPSPKPILEKSVEFLRQNPENRLVIIGNCRNLIFYLQSFELWGSERISCLKQNDYAAQWANTDRHRNYIMLYLLPDMQNYAKKLNRKILIQSQDTILLESQDVSKGGAADSTGSVPD